MPTGWKGSDRRHTLPANWGQTCLRILNRDHHRCQWVRQDTDRRCLAKAHDVDHRTPHSEGGTDDDSNLWALCTWHHARKTGIEGGTASGVARRAKRDAAKAIHPGLMDAPSTPPHQDPPPF